MMKLFQKAISKLDNKFGNRRWYQSVKNDYVVRTLVFSACGTLITICFAVYNVVFSVLNSSLWYGAFAGYLIVLVLQRLSVLLVYGVVGKRFNNDSLRLQRSKFKIYLANGVVCLPIATALFVVIVLLVNAQKPVVSNEILAITTAVFAFYKITVAILNFNKSRKLNDYLVQTVRNICLIDAVVSIILLESTLVTTFGELNHEMYLLMIVSGLLGCVFALSLGVSMVITAAKHLRRNES